MSMNVGLFLSFFFVKHISKYVYLLLFQYGKLLLTLDSAYAMKSAIFYYITVKRLLCIALVLKKCIHIYIKVYVCLEN